MSNLFHRVQKKTGPELEWCSGRLLAQAGGGGVALR